MNCRKERQSWKQQCGSGLPLRQVDGLKSMRLIYRREKGGCDPSPRGNKSPGRRCAIEMLAAAPSTTFTSAIDVDRYLKSKRDAPVHLDTDALIYSCSSIVVEHIELHATLIHPLRRATHASQFMITRSELALLETLVKPFQYGDTVLAASYRALLLASGEVELQAMTPALIEAASWLRAGCTVKCKPQALFIQDDPIEQSCVPYQHTCYTHRQGYNGSPQVMPSAAAGIEVASDSFTPAARAARLRHCHGRDCNAR